MIPKNDGLNVNHVQKSSNFDLFMLVNESYLIRMFRRQNEDIGMMYKQIY